MLRNRGSMVEGSRVDLITLSVIGVHSPGQPGRHQRRVQGGNGQLDQHVTLRVEEGVDGDAAHHDGL